MAEAPPPPMGTHIEGEGSVYMETTPEVIAALNASLRIERTIVDYCHDTENWYKGRKTWCKYAEWWDSRVAETKEKRRSLLCCLSACGSVPGVESDPYEISDDVTTALNRLKEYEQKAMESYRSGYEVAEEAKEYDIADEVFCVALAKSREMIIKTEALLTEFQALGAQAL